MSDKLGQVTIAIHERRIVSFSIGGRSYRGEPHLVGVNRDGDLVLRMCVTSEKQPRLRDFNMREIEALELTQERFERARPQYDPLSANLLWIIERL